MDNRKLTAWYRMGGKLFDWEGNYIKNAPRKVQETGAPYYFKSI